MHNTPEYAAFNYALWLRRGHEGTMDDFLEWLRGDKGDPGDIALGYVLVESYGAKGDGTTDDSKAIKAAITAAGEGGTVILKSGSEYLVTETLELSDGQTLDGNGATMIFRVPPEMSSGGTISTAYPIIRVEGSADGEFEILEKPRVMGGAGSSGQGAAYPYGYVYIKVGTNPGYKTGDRIIIQAARNALAPESGLYWCGTPTHNAGPTHWAEALVVNGVDKTGYSEWTIQCVGSLVYPYYLPGPQEGVDISKAKVPALNGNDKQIGWYVKSDAALLCRPHSTVRKANFKRDVTIRNINIIAEGITHSGDRSVNGGWRGTQYGNTIYLRLCENARIENVRMTLSDFGRGFAMFNCLNSVFKDCHYETDYRMYGPAESHTYANVFTFASCWRCTADGCSTLRAGQSFDTAYVSADATGMFADVIPCPSIYTTVRDCVVTESMGSATTNHSGVWGSLFENCRFIRCAVPASIRSPYTVMRGCTFAGNAGSETATKDPTGDKDYYHRENYAIWLYEPTTYGCRIEDCVFNGTRGIYINPWVASFFNWEKGNYFEVDESDPDKCKETYVYPDNPNTNRFAPTNRTLGVKISRNMFVGSQGALYAVRISQWLVNRQGALTDYAFQDLGVEFSDNTLIGCGEHFYPIWLEPYSHGFIFARNRFLRCDGGTYYTEGGSEKPVNTLIYVTSECIRISVVDNVVENCGGNFKWLTSAPTTAASELVPFLSSQLELHGNKIISSDGIAETSQTRDTDLHFVGRGAVREDLYAEVPDNNVINRTGHVYDFAEQEIDFVINNGTIVRLTPTALVGASAAPGDSLLRTWTNIQPTAARTAKWRLALYDGDNGMTMERFQKVCACWDAGEDAAGNAVTFASSVVVEETIVDEESGEETTVQITCAPPLNKALNYWHAGTWVGSDNSKYSVDSSTGIVTINVPADPSRTDKYYVSAFEKVPGGFSPSFGDTFVLMAQVLEQHLSDSIRFNVDYPVRPAVFKQDLRGSSGDVAEGKPRYYEYILTYTELESTDLGTEDVPWGDLYAGDANVTALRVQRDNSVATIDLTSPADGNGDRATASIYKNANTSADLGTVLRDRPRGGNDNNSVALILRKGALTPQSQLQFARTENGVATQYNLYGEHNVPTPSDIGAASVNDIYDTAMINEIVTGSPAMISDGADDIPVKSLIAVINTVQEGSGTPDVTNPRLFAPWTAAKISMGGRNLLVDEWDTTSGTSGDATLSKSGDDFVVDGSNTSGIALNFYIKRYDTASAFSLPAGTYTLSGLAAGSACRLALYKREGGANTVLAYIENGTLTKTVTLSAKTDNCFVVISVPNNAAPSSEHIRPMLTWGSDAADFEPYTDVAHTIPFGTEAGNVYGGTLNVTTGELTVTHKMVDLGTKWWSLETRYGCNLFYTNLEDYDGSSDTSAMSAYPHTDHPYDASFPDTAWRESTAIPRINIRDDRYASAAEFRAGVSGVEFVYKLAEPLIYTLAPTEVRTLLGGNNISADTGDVSVAYRADTALYVQQQIAAAGS